MRIGSICFCLFGQEELISKIQYEAWEGVRGGVAWHDEDLAHQSVGEFDKNVPGLHRLLVAHMMPSVIGNTTDRMGVF